MNKNKKTTHACDEQILKQGFDYLKLTAFQTNYDTLAKRAAQDNWTYTRFLAELVHDEVSLRKQRSIERRIRMARFPVLKTLIIFIGGVGLGKSHLSTALGYQACLKGHSVLFVSAIDIINTLTAAQNAGRFKAEMKKYVKPALLIIDELGYLPVDRNGADLLFTVISKRYEKTPIVLTTNKPFKKWPEIFNNDSTLTSAVLDRLLHHAEVSVIEGKSYRMKDRINE